MVAMVTVWAEEAVSILSVQKTGPLRSVNGFKMAVRARADWAFVCCDDSVRRRTTEGLELLFILISELFPDGGDG